MTQIVSKQQAHTIALSRLSKAALAVMDEPWYGGRPRVIDKPEGRINIYRTWPEEPVWYVYVPWDDGLVYIRSSRVILIAKKDGRVLYDGGAGVEGWLRDCTGISESVVVMST